MRKLFRYPGLTLALVMMWLLLSQSMAPAHILFGLITALFATWVMAHLEVTPAGVRITSAISRLAASVLHDIVRSNIAVAWIILSRGAQPTSGFVRIPLDTSNRYCLAGLACIITATPGTLWMEHDSRRNILLLHVLDLVDEQHWVDLIKRRYERLLMEVFE
jgi:multicomponent K+:H+ antiporter subunit E